MDLIERVETFILSLPREVPYLGPLGPGEHINAKGYIVRRGNRSIYPTTDMSVLVKIRTQDGRIGWGETYGLPDHQYQGITNPSGDDTEDPATQDPSEDSSQQ